VRSAAVEGGRCILAGLDVGIHSMGRKPAHLLQTTISRHFHFPTAGVV